MSSDTTANTSEEPQSEKPQVKDSNAAPSKPSTRIVTDDSSTSRNPVKTQPLNPGQQPDNEPSAFVLQEDRIPGVDPVYKKEEFKPEKLREYSRSGIAFCLIGFLGGTILLVLIPTLFGNFTTDDAEKIFCTVLSPLIGLVGAATGFYYGGKNE